VKKSGAQAGYMELRGAVKDGDCKEVSVPGGVSKQRGCCNEYKPKTASTDEFKCGECHHLMTHPATLIQLRRPA
jgi:hypothetical protein